MAQLASKAEPFQKLRIIKERYRTTAWAVGHIAPLPLEDASLFPARADQ